MKKGLYIILLFGVFFLFGCNKEIAFKYILENDKVIIQGFENEEKIDKLSIPKKYENKEVIGISQDAFKGSSFTKLYLPNTLLKIEGGAFANCSIDDFYFDGTLEEWCNITFSQYWGSGAQNFYYRNEKNNYCLAKDIVFSKEIKKIPDYSFLYFYCVQSIHLNKELESIGRFVFWTEKKNKTLHYDGTLSDWCKMEFGFYWNDGIEHFIIDDKEIIHLVIPSDITDINQYSFHNLVSLESITIPKSVKYIGECSFDLCSKVSKFYYEGTVEEWGKIIIAENHVYFGKQIEYLNK